MPPKRQNANSRHGQRTSYNQFKKSTPKYKKNISTSSVALLYGLHSVAAALANPLRKIYSFKLTRNALSKLQEQIKGRATDKERAIEPEIVDPRELDKLLGAETVHQGVLLEVEPLATIAIEDLPPRSPLLVLDQVTDPHNVGAIIRSAAAFDIQGLILTERHSPPFSGTLAKTASGGLEHVPICLVSNLAQALQKLGDFNYWRIGLDSAGDHFLEDQTLTQQTALVLGAEGKGLRRLTAEHCDTICKIKTAAPISSLNVSNAAAIALHSLYCKMQTS